MLAITKAHLYKKAALSNCRLNHLEPLGSYSTIFAQPFVIKVKKKLSAKEDTKKTVMKVFVLIHASSLLSNTWINIFFYMAFPPLPFQHKTVGDNYMS